MLSAKPFSGKVSEAAAVLFLFVAAFHFGAELYADRYQDAHFYQRYFTPAVSIACSEGFVDIDWDASPELADFLVAKNDSFDCSSLPQPLPVREKDHYTSFMKLHRYLVTSVGVYWKLVGKISWSGMTWYAGFFYGSFIISCYAIFRLGMGKAVAFLIALLLLVSLLQSSTLLGLRDFSKTPFIAVLMALIGLVAVHPLSRSKLFISAIIFGAVTGIGIGFRQDVAICVPPFLVTLLFFRPEGIKAGTKDAMLATLLMAIPLMAFVYPILPGEDLGSNSWHVALLGLLPGFGGEMGVDASPLYQWINAPTDGYVLHMTTAFQALSTENITFFPFPSKTYDSAGFAHYLTIIKTFPADFLARFYAVVVSILELPFSPIGSKPPVSGDLYALLHSLRYFITNPFAGSGLYIALSVVSIIAMKDLRLALFTILFVCYFSGYPMIQFATRHYYHLELIGLWATGFILHHLLFNITIAYQAFRGSAPISLPWRRICLGISVAVILPLVLAGALSASRLYQESLLYPLFEKMMTAPSTQLPITAIDWNGKRVIPGPKYEKTEGQDPFINIDYLVAQFDLEKCGKEKVSSRTFYYTRKGWNDYTASTIVSTKRAILIFPVFDSSVTSFTGLVFSPGDEECVTELSIVTDTAGFSLPLYLNLPDDWRDRPLFTKIARFEQ